MSAGWLTFMLVVVRLAGFMVTAPFFSRRDFPALAKIGFTFALALLVLPLVDVPEFDGRYVVQIVMETCLGLLTGSIASLVFMGVQGAGHFLDQQAGYGMAVIFDPGAGQVSLLARMYAMLGMLLFTVMDGHRSLIMVALTSFRLVPLGVVELEAGLLNIVLYAFSASILFVFRFAVPVATVLFLTDLLLGIVGKTVPQLNVLMMGMPVKALLTALVLIAILPAYISVTEALTGEINRLLVQMLEVAQ